MSEELLRIGHLHVSFATRRGVVEAVRGISLSLAEGETLGVVGESGSGKSATAYAISGLLDGAGRVAGGEVWFRGRDMVRASKEDMRALRGSALSMIFQNPRGALNPIRTVGQQLADAIKAHGDPSAADLRKRIDDLLGAVALRDTERVLRAYPHEMSGGMCQRIMIAMAIACEPQLLIADEPTTGLDVTTQKAVMDLLAGLAAKRRMGMILITHDLALASTYCDRIAVMQNGKIVEEGPALDLLRSPQHIYTRKLVDASPTETSSLPGPSGQSVGQCPLVEREKCGTRPLLEVRGLDKRFETFHAVKDVSFTIGRGESVGLVGESGSGKSTISRIVTRLMDASEGSILFDGIEISQTQALSFHRSRFRRDIQIVFQDPHDSLNPRYTAFDCIAHPLKRLETGISSREIRARVDLCATRVGLGLDLLSRFPHQLSGGQKARVGIARAIATRPKLLVLDEPTAALDVSVQAVVLSLLDSLRRSQGLSFLFVSHDLNVVRMLCERVIVLRHGEIVEEATSSDLFSRPATAYTRALLKAAPRFPTESARDHVAADF